MLTGTYGGSVADGRTGTEVCIHKAEMLCERNSMMMKDFSTQCVSRLNRHRAFRLFLSFVQHFIEANVHKEIQKDSLVIRHAAAGFETGRDRGKIAVEELFELTKQIDREFMSRLPVHFFSSEVRHDDFAEIRKQRISLLVCVVYSLLSNWGDEAPFEIIVRRSYSEDDYRQVLGEILRLYNLETKALSSAIRFHGPARTIKDFFEMKLFETLESTAGEIADEYTRRVYRCKASPAAHPSSA